MIFRLIELRYFLEETSWEISRILVTKNKRNRYRRDCFYVRGHRGLKINQTVDKLAKKVVGLK